MSARCKCGLDLCLSVKLGVNVALTSASLCQLGVNVALTSASLCQLGLDVALTSVSFS